MEGYSKQTLLSAGSHISETVTSADSNYKLLLKIGLSKLTQHPLSPSTKKYYDNYLFTLVDTYPNLDAIYITDMSEHIYGIDKSGIKTLNINSLEEASWYNDVLNAKGSYLLYYNAGNIFIPNFQQNFISSIRVINDLETQRPVGFSIFNIPMTSVLDYFETVFGTEEIPVAIYDEEMNPIFTSENWSIPSNNISLLNSADQNHRFVSHKEAQSIFAGIYLPELNWKLAAYFPIKATSSFTGSLVVVSISVLILNIILMFAFSRFISSSINRPVNLLISAMKRSETGELTPVKIMYPESEFGILEQKYNHMLKKLNLLMERLITEQKMKRIIELKSLQEQIKPHFLYNTLDAIGYLALTDNPEKVYDAIETLGSFYRHSLSDGRQIITVAQEIQIVKDYSSLLSIRYENLFIITYEVDPNALSCPILKLLLQPLVENSVYHGIKPLGEQGKINIKVLKKEYSILFKISDNGIGMKKSLIEKILEKNSEDQANSFGLAGTIERLRISYGESLLFQICSEKGQGTTIIFEIPCEHQ